MSAQNSVAGDLTTPLGSEDHGSRVPDQVVVDLSHDVLALDAVTNRQRPTETQVQRRTLRQQLRAYLVKPKRKQEWLGFVVFWGVVAAGIGYASYKYYPTLVENVINPALDYVREHTTRGEVWGIVIACCTLSPIIFISTSYWILLAAAILPFWEALAAVEIGTTLGMAIPYLLGRKLLRRRVTKWVQGKAYFEALVASVADLGQFRVVVLMRLGPIPLHWLNYFCAVCRDITFWPYITASVLGHAPANAIAVYLGRNIVGLAQLLRGENVNAVTILDYTLGFISSLLITVFGIWYFKRALRRIRERNAARLAAELEAEAGEDAESAGGSADVQALVEQATAEWAANDGSDSIELKSPKREAGEVEVTARGAK